MFRFWNHSSRMSTLSSKSTLVAAIILELLSGFVHVAVSDCSAGWSEFSSSCYTLAGSSQNWNTAYSTCQALGASLVEITSEAENDFVNGVSNGFHIWLHCRDHLTNGEYVCGDDDHVPTYTSWGQSLPADNPGYECVMFLDGAWSDANCAFGISVVCEIAGAVTVAASSTNEQPPPSTTVVTTAEPVPSTAAGTTDQPVPTTAQVTTDQPVPSTSQVTTDIAHVTATDDPVPSTAAVSTDLPAPSTVQVTTDQSVPSTAAVTTEEPVSSTVAQSNSEQRTSTGYMKKISGRTGYCLVNHVIKDIQSSSLIQCMASCISLPSCSSMNVLTVTGRCQLNKSNLKKSSSDFQAVDDCEYFEYIL